MRYKKFLIWGSILFLLSFLQYLLPKTAFFQISLWWAFYIGFCLIFEGITRGLERRSLLAELINNKKYLVYFAITSLLGGFILDLVCVWLGKLWIYPANPPVLIYLILFIPGWSIYWLSIAESYFASKAIWDHFFPAKKQITKPYAYEKILFNLVGIIGLLAFLAAVSLLIRDLSAQKIALVELTRPIKYQVDFSLILLAFLGCWFILEYFEFRKKGTSLLKDFFHQYPGPILAIISISAIYAIVMEFENVPAGFWIYTNWPLPRFQIAGLPLLIFLAWPLQYIGFLSLYRVIAKGPTGEIWQPEN